MATKKRAKVVPPRGPASNLRPAGVHEDKKRKMLDRLSKREREMDDLKALGAWAFEDDA